MERRKEDFIKYLEQSCGIINAACKKAQIDRKTYYNWCDADEEFHQACFMALELQGDFVESKLLEKINDGDTTAIIFYCKTKLKNRGYSEKSPQPAKKTRTEDNTPAVAWGTEYKKKLSAKITYITNLLKEEKKYSAELSCQVEITAELLVKMDIVRQKMLDEGYSPINVEISREGNSRNSVNPMERLYLDLSQSSQRALRALGMNTESRERAVVNDGFNDFLNSINQE